MTAADGGGGTRNRTDRLDNPVADHLGYLLRQAQLGVFEHFTQSVAGFDLRASEYTVLNVILRNPGSRQSEVGDALAVKHANLSTLIDRLARRGLVERVGVESDRRAVELRLSASGHALIRRVNAAATRHRAFLRELFDGEDHDTLVRLLTDLVARLGRGTRTTS